VVDGIPCVYGLQTSIAADSGEEQRKCRDVDVTARFMPERSSESPFTLDSIHFEPALLPTETVISIGGIKVVGGTKRHADIMVDGGESVRDPEVKRSRRDWTPAEKDILRAKWAVHPDEVSNPPLTRQLWLTKLRNHHHGSVGSKSSIQNFLNPHHPLPKLVYLLPTLLCLAVVYVYRSPTSTLWILPTSPPWVKRF
jgi:hypothetical protein